MNVIVGANPPHFTPRRDATRKKFTRSCDLEFTFLNLDILMLHHLLSLKLIMPLDTTSTYAQTLLRQDGRRWNELRQITASISTQPSSDGSSLLTMGNTVVVCTVTGPRERYFNIYSILIISHV
jgi:hypothetical protein